MHFKMGQLDKTKDYYLQCERIIEKMENEKQLKISKLEWDHML